MSKRIEYIDALRGFAIILVVLGHVWSFSIYDTTTNLLSTNSICNFTNIFHVALFFYISGFVFYKPNTQWGGISIICFTIKKFKTLLIPAIVFIIIYNACFTNYNLLDIARTNYKLGYWFTITLFEIFALHIITVFITRNQKKLSLSVSFFTSLILYICIQTNIFSNYYNTSCFKLFSIQQLSFYFFFQCGIITKYKYNSLIYIITKEWFKSTIILTLFVTSYMYFFVKPSSVFFDIKNKIIYILPLLITLSAIITCYFVFYKIQLDGHDNYVWRKLQYIGTRTLDIYFIHYFFLPENLPSIFRDLIHNNCLLELYISIPITIGLIIACICVSKLIRMSHFLALIMLGSTK